MTSPRISIVVPVREGEGAPQELLRSLAAQEYAELEVLVESHASMARALDRGFARAQGEILGYLRPGTFLLPGALRDVATRIDAPSGRHVVMGGAMLLADGMDSIGVPHPREYLGLFDHLAVWKRGFNAVPASSLFWHRSLRERVRDLAAEEPDAVDYEIVCRVGRHFTIHPVDGAWSVMRLPTERRISEPEMLGLLVDVSRRYWGSPLSPLRWRCEAAYRRYRRQPHEHARHHARLAEKAALAGRRLVAWRELLATWMHSPAMARARLAGIYRRGLARKSR